MSKKIPRLFRRIVYGSREHIERAGMALARRLKRKAPDVIKVAAGSTANFPIISHTFVYQELTALHEMMGADVKLFHTQDGDRAHLHAAFEYLDHNRTHFVSKWEVHLADYKHYQKTVPDRVESLLAALSEESGMPREELEKRYELMLAFTHARRVETWGADYVHTYFFYDQALNGLVASWLLDLPRGVSTYADHMMSDWALKCVPLHLRTADVIVATSQRISDELIGIGGPEIAHKVVVKPNGVDGRRFPFVDRKPVESRPLELICITRIEPKKGMHELVDAAKLLKDRGFDVRIHVIGGTDEGNESSEAYGIEFEKRIADHDVGATLIRHGRMKQEEMQPLLERADAFVAPFVETESGDKDGIPTAILEAMSSGLPIVATTAGSIPEIVDDTVEGFLVPQKDPAALADAIERLGAEPGLSPRLGAAARTRFDRDFDIHATEPRFHELVAKAVRERAKRRR